MDRALKRPKLSTPRINDIQGHISNRICMNQEYPNLPGARRYIKIKWLPLILSKFSSDMRVFVARWHLLGLITHAKHYDQIHLDWGAMGALIEIWHPSTHTFLFSTFEATILLEEIEMILGLKRMKQSEEEHMAIMPRPISPHELLTSLIPNPNLVNQIKITKGINLLKLASWVYKRADQAKEEEEIERITKAFVVCIAGALLFPSTEDFLEESQISAVVSLWEGERVGPAILAYLYSGLTSAAMGRPIYGCMLAFSSWVDLHFKFDPCHEAQQSSRIFSKSPLSYIASSLGISNRVTNRIPQIKRRAEWREHLKVMPKNLFTCTPGILKMQELRARFSIGTDLRLIGASELILYNAHRCLPQLGLPRQVLEDISHLPPIKSRALGNNEDGEETITIQALWKLSKLHQPVEDLEEAKEQWKNYVIALRKLRPKVAH